MHKGRQPTSPREPHRRRDDLRAIALGLALAAGATVAADAQPADYARPGRLVRLADGRRLNFRCSGQGSPTIVFESGWGATSEAWSPIQPRLQQTTRVCAYDRAGYGFSDPGPAPRDGAAVARDLDEGLRAAGERPPFLAVGHSAGGLYVQLFAARRPRGQVVGLVLLDPMVEHQESRFADAFGPGAGSLAPIRQTVTRCQPSASGAAVPTDCPRVPAAQMAAEVGELDELSVRTSVEVDRVSMRVRSIPTVVLTARPPKAAPDDPGYLAWRGFHQQLAARFEHGSEREIASSHLVMSDRPSDVVALILAEVARVRGGRGR